MILRPRRKYSRRYLIAELVGMRLKSKRNHIFRLLICGSTLVLFISTIQSCATTTNIPKSKYDGIEQSKRQDYKVKLKDGTNYKASRVAVDDSILTILAIDNSEGTRSQSLIYDNLPYSILLDEVESIKLCKSPSFISYLYVGFIVLAISLGILVANLDFSPGLR